MDIIYNIEDLYYCKRRKTFIGFKEYLFPMYGDYYVSFPNESKKFYIRNLKTNSQCRFILSHICDYEGIRKYVFKSDDDLNLLCIVICPYSPLAA